MAEIIPDTAKSRTNGAASGIVWIPHANGSCYGAAAFASNRGDFERAAAFAGTVARVCFFGADANHTDICESTIALAKEVYRRAQAKLTRGTVEPIHGYEE